MKARLPKGYGSGGANNIQQLARQAQKLQDDMEAASKELETKEYEATAGGGAVKVTVTGKMELTKVEISPEVVDPEDVEMLSDISLGLPKMRQSEQPLRKKRTKWKQSQADLTFRECSDYVGI